LRSAPARRRAAGSRRHQDTLPQQPTGQCQLLVRVESGELRGRERPPVDDDRESGRGLLIVSAVADEVGVEQVPGDGKQVYASFDT